MSKSCYSRYKVVTGWIRWAEEEKFLSPKLSEIIIQAAGKDRMPGCWRSCDRTKKQVREILLGLRRQFHLPHFFITFQHLITILKNSIFPEGNSYKMVLWYRKWGKLFNKNLWHDCQLLWVWLKNRRNELYSLRHYAFNCPKKKYRKTFFFSFRSIFPPEKLNLLCQLDHLKLTSKNKKISQMDLWLGPMWYMAGSTADPDFKF